MNSAAEAGTGIGEGEVGIFDSADDWIVCLKKGEGYMYRAICLINVDKLVKNPKTVMPDLIPAKNGIFDRHPELIEFTGFALFRFRRNDIKTCFSTFYETINLRYPVNKTISERR
jgi:hypothetical protein